MPARDPQRRGDAAPVVQHRVADRLQMRRDAVVALFVEPLLDNPMPHRPQVDVLAVLDLGLDRAAERKHVPVIGAARVLAVVGAHVAMHRGRRLKHDPVAAAVPRGGGRLVSEQTAASQRHDGGGRSEQAADGAHRRRTQQPSGVSARRATRPLTRPGRSSRRRGGCARRPWTRRGGRSATPAGGCRRSRGMWPQPGVRRPRRPRSR